MLLRWCINLWYTCISNAMRISGLSVSDRVEMKKAQTGAALLIKDTDVICARNYEKDQDSSG